MRRSPLGVAATIAKFQSTHPSGVRRQRVRLVRRARQISIHAPQWGATRPRPRPCPASWNFNPRTPVGCDVYRAVAVTGIANFNPRTPVGCDRPGHHLGGEAYHFNPRTPVGCDTTGTSGVSQTNSFQSTHPSGVRRVSSSICLFLPYISIHAPQWGATRHVLPPNHCKPFQSTHPSGVRLVN